MRRPYAGLASRLHGVTSMTATWYEKIWKILERRQELGGYKKHNICHEYFHIFQSVSQSVKLVGAGLKYLSRRYEKAESRDIVSLKMALSTSLAGRAVKKIEPLTGAAMRHDILTAMYY
jgi:hypothetical protein